MSAAVVAVTAWSLSGCGGNVFLDTPLDVTAGEIGYAPGEDVTGEVVHPDGSMTVTLAPVPSGLDQQFGTNAPEQELASPETVRCDYSPDTRRYSCPTTGLGEGLYVVRVTDAAQPGERTQGVFVAISRSVGYEPTAGVVPVGDDGIRAVRDTAVLGTAGEPTPVRLDGWRPGSTVRLRVRAEDGTRVFGTRVRVGADGGAVVLVDPLPAGNSYTIPVTDGLWNVTVPFAVTS